MNAVTPTITLDNYEEYLILQVDGELSAGEERELEVFLAAHPELEAEAAAYAAVKLVPDENIVFEGKEALLKPEPATTTKPISLSPWAWAAAAVLMVWMGVRLVQEPSGSEVSGTVAQVQPPVKVQQPVKPEEVDRKPAQPQPQPVAVASAKPVKNRANSIAAPVKEDKVPVQVEQREPAYLAQLEPSTTTSVIIPPGGLQMPVPRVVEVAQIEQPVASAEAPRTINIPIAPERLEMLASLASAARNKVEQAKKLRQSIRNTEATVAFAGRELFTLRF
jgi:anti-sigma factor RsiW